MYTILTNIKMLPIKKKKNVDEANDDSRNQDLLWLYDMNYDWWKMLSLFSFSTLVYNTIMKKKNLGKSIFLPF